MLPESASFDLNQLAEAAGVSQRTVRYYIQQGLLPSPEARGPGAHYGDDHLDLLRLIKRMQREHLPLAEIRRRLEKLSPVAIREILKREPEPPAEKAVDYIRSVLKERDAATDHRSKAPLRAAESQSSPGMPGAWQQRARSQWDRVVLAPDVELHVRRPLSREQNKQVERLLDAARTIFEDGP